jgi:hypothetical protein
LAPRRTYWTNTSVLSLIKHSGADPIQAVTEKARFLALNAIERGWSGPPYDPFALADLLKIRVIPR